MSLQSRVQVVVKGESGSINYAGDMGVRQHLGGVLCRLSTCYALQRAQAVPGVIHTAGFPLTITYKPGLKTHSTTSTIPDPGLPAASS